jgi:hypothetical protein
MYRTSHTTENNKAKCLNYRNGKRCGRKAVALVNFINPVNRLPGHMPRCMECAHADDVTFRTICKAGYEVCPPDPRDRMQQRRYNPCGEGYAEEVDPRDKDGAD